MSGFIHVTFTGKQYAVSKRSIKIALGKIKCSEACYGALSIVAVSLLKNSDPGLMLFHE